MLPWQVFLVVACTLYFLPFFEPRRLFVPFLITLVLGAFVPRELSAGSGLAPNIAGATFFFSLFFLIVGIKDLLFVERILAYEIALFVLFLLLFVLFFAGADRPDGELRFLATAVIPLIVFPLTSSFFSYASFGDRRRRAFLSWLISALVWEASFVILLLPLSFMSQSALLFLFAALLLDASREYLRGRGEGKRMAGYAGALAFLAVVIVWVA